MEETVKRAKRKYHIPELVIDCIKCDDILMESGWGTDKIFDDNFNPQDDGFGG